MKAFRLGPVHFQYEPDGDDPGTGWLRVTLDDDQCQVGCSRVEWDEFVEETAPEYPREALRSSADGGNYPNIDSGSGA